MRLNTANYYRQIKDVYTDIHTHTGNTNDSIDNEILLPKERHNTIPHNKRNTENVRTK